MFFGFDVYMNVHDPQKLGSEIQRGKLVPTGGIQIEVMPEKATAIASTLTASAVHYGPIGSDAGSSAILAVEGENQGRCVYFAMPVGNRYLEFGVEDHRQLLASAVRWAARVAPPVQAVNAPKTLALTAFHQASENRLIIHLVNSVLDEVLRPIVDVAEVGNVELKIAMKSPPKRVKVWGETQEPEWNMDAKNLNVRVPMFRYHSVILVEE
jgi:hypothetical protein